MITSIIAAYLTVGAIKFAIQLPAIIHGIMDILSISAEMNGKPITAMIATIAIILAAFIYIPIWPIAILKSK